MEWLNLIGDLVNGRVYGAEEAQEYLMSFKHNEKEQVLVMVEDRRARKRKVCTALYVAHHREIYISMQKDFYVEDLFFDFDKEWYERYSFRYYGYEVIKMASIGSPREGGTPWTDSENGER